MANIFDKQPHLKPSSMASVAERRFGDAESLAKTEENARANGVAYLAGFVIEILLKARLVSKFPGIARKRQHDLRNEEREIWSLIWRRHDLGAMLGVMPELDAHREKMGERSGAGYLSNLRIVCATWTVYARYSTETIQMDEAVRLLERVRMLNEVLK